MENFFVEVFKPKDLTLAKKLNEMSELLILERNDTLINIGDLPENLYFFKSGLAIGYYYDKSGNEVIECIGAHQGITMMQGFALDKPSKIIIQALRRTEVVSVPMKPALDLILKDPEGISWYIKIAADMAEQHLKHKTVLSTCSARGRYEWFLKEYPDVANDMSDRRIASFLAITPVTLSRVRHDMRLEAAAAEKAPAWEEAAAVADAKAEDTGAATDDAAQTDTAPPPPKKRRARKRA